MAYRCAALNKTGGRCSSEAVESNGWWRCERHTDWYETATKEERAKLAWLEIEDCIRELDAEDRFLSPDLDTHRS